MGDHSAPEAPSKVSYLRDVLERTGWTFLQSFFGILTVTWVGDIPADWKTWLLSAAVSSALAALKGSFAGGVGDPNTAALLRLPKDK